MEIIKEYLRNIGIICLAALVSAGSLMVIKNLEIFWNFQEIIYVYIIDIFVISIFNICIIKRIMSEDKKIKNLATIGKYYKGTVLINIIITIISYIIAYLLLSVTTILNNIIVLAIVSILMYLIKMFLSFTLYVYIDKEEKIMSSIKCSLKIVSKNFIKVLVYNIGFLVLIYIIRSIRIAFGESLSVYNMWTEFLILTFLELGTYIVFVANVKLYKKLN